MARISVVHLGHSHLAAMIPALYDRALGEDDLGNEIVHYVFNVNNYKLFGLGDERFSYGVLVDGEYKLNPIVAQLIHETVPPDNYVALSTMLGGNVHNSLGLLQAPEGLDFLPPDQVDLPLLDGAQIVPYALARAAMAEQCEIYLNDLRGVRSSTTGRMFHVMPPPPIKDDTYLASIVDRDPYFASLGRNTITPSSVRHKLWQLHNSIYAETCAELDVEVVTPPEESMIDGRWLSSDCIGPDPTHGNMLYGARILRKIEGLLEGRFAGWAWIG
jgi:hypothetical protein